MTGKCKAFLYENIQIRFTCAAPCRILVDLYVFLVDLYIGIDIGRMFNYNLTTKNISSTHLRRHPWDYFSKPSKSTSNPTKDF